MVHYPIVVLNFSLVLGCNLFLPRIGGDLGVNTGILAVFGVDLGIFVGILARIGSF